MELPEKKTVPGTKRESPKSPKSLTKNAPPISTPAAKASAKTFSIGELADKYGQKTLVYAASGMGKSSLAMTAPAPVFIGLDDGARNLRHPVTGDPPKFVEGVETFADVRAALQQPGLYANYESIVIDTATELQDLSIPYMLDTIMTEKGGRAKNIHSYGYNKGFDHQYDTMKLILQDCDALIRQGKNIILIAQALPFKISNPGGEDYLCDGPRLSTRTPNVMALYCEWVDHLLRIDYEAVVVSKEKKISGSTTRAIYVEGEPHFRAKSRTIHERVVSFEDAGDDSIWQFMHPEKYGDTE